MHEERHYKKLIPLTLNHKYLVMVTRTKIWEYYKELKKYKENATEQKKQELLKQFGSRMSNPCCYCLLPLLVAFYYILCKLNKKCYRFYFSIDNYIKNGAAAVT